MSGYTVFAQVGVKREEVASFPGLPRCWHSGHRTIMGVCSYCGRLLVCLGIYHERVHCICTGGCEEGRGGGKILATGGCEEGRGGGKILATGGCEEVEGRS